MRGELSLRGFSVHRRTGSSPLARGTQSPGFFCSPQNRFIPACAGNSIELNKPIICSPVHPRLRGELRFHLLGARFLIGSSPLARGTRLNTLGSRFFRRFIPACAGNSGLRPAFLKSPTVHPRLRGELWARGGSRYTETGSSPLARGTPINALPFRAYNRFIPACAGNSPQNLQKVHYLNGSSPLARGTLAYRLCF